MLQCGLAFALLSFTLRHAKQVVIPAITFLTIWQSQTVNNGQMSRLVPEGIYDKL